MRKVTVWIGPKDTLIPADLMERCRIEAEGIWSDKKPQKWYFAIPVVLIWLGFLWLFWLLFRIAA